MPLTSLVALVFLGPWGLAVLVGYQQAKRFESVAGMYKDSIRLVKDHQLLVEGYKGIVNSQQDLIIHTTQTLTAIKSVAENNLYCPMVRRETSGKKEPHG